MAGAFICGMGLKDTMAQEWQPTQNVELIVGSGTGGGLDLVVRKIQQIVQADALTPTSMTVVNKPGGSNSLGWIYMNQHPGDGHYLSLLLPTFITNSITGTNTIARSDVTPIVQLFNESTTFLINSNSDIKTGQDLIAKFKADPASVTVGMSAVGSGHHLACVQLLQKIGADPAKLKTVIFTSGGELITALRGGHVDMLLVAAGTTIGQLGDGVIKGVAIASTERLKGELADIPTLKELGVDVVSSNWRGIIGPKGLGAAEVKYWEDIMAKVVETAEWKKLVEDNSYEATFMRSAELNDFLTAEEGRFREAFTAIGLAQ